MKTLDWWEIVQQIEDGAFDNELRFLNDALKKRHAVVLAEQTATVAATVDEGDKVLLTNIKPKYLNGAVATVVKVNQTRAVVVLDEPVRKYTGEMTVPLCCLVVKEKEVVA